MTFWIFLFQMKAPARRCFWNIYAEQEIKVKKKTRNSKNIWQRWQNSNKTKSPASVWTLVWSSYWVLGRFFISSGPFGGTNLNNDTFVLKEELSDICSTIYSPEPCRITDNLPFVHTFNLHVPECGVTVVVVFG